MTLATPPRNPTTDDDRDLARRVADLEALIEEARRRARRRRIRNATALITAAAAGVAGLIGFHGGGGGSAGTTALAGGSNARGQASGLVPPLAALPAGDEALAFAFDPRRPNVVYVASPHARGGAYIYKTTDDGQHWRSTGAKGTGWISDVLSLTADPRHPGTLYAGTDTAVYKTIDGGRNWRPFNQGLFPTHDRRVCYRPAGAKRRCFTMDFGSAGSTSWNHNNGWVADVAVDPINGNVVYSAAGAVRKSTDGGHTWKTVFVPKQWDGGVSRVAIAPTRPESLYAITHAFYSGATTIYKSTNAGRTWRPTGGASSLPPSCCWDSTDALAVDSQNPQTLYAAVGGSILATTDGGATWQPMMNGLPAIGVTSLATDPRRTGTLYATVDTSQTSKSKTGNIEKSIGAIYKTTDGGQTWSAVFSGFGVEKIAVDPTRPSTVYAGGLAGRSPTRPNTFRLLRSTNGGRTWAIAR
jgi:photosystem II stability/assembly factor-like uncharacterized protein